MKIYYRFRQMVALLMVISLLLRRGSVHLQSARKKAMRKAM